MKIFRKVITLLMAVLVLLSFAACSKDKGPGETNGGNNQDSVNTSSEIYEFKINLFGDTYTLPAELEEFKNNGWTYANNDNPESKDVNANGYATCDVLKDGKRITLTVINLGTNTKKFGDCKVGSIDCTFSSANDMTFNLANKLNATKDTTVDDVIGKFGEATKTINGDSGTTLRYEKETYVYYVFTFNTEGKLTYVDIRNWKNDGEASSDEVDLSFLESYKSPSALTDNYSDYIFRLEGKMYQLPAPVSSFVDNGWTLASFPDSIPAGDEITSGLTIKKGDVELTCTVKNFANGAVEAKDAMITGVFLNGEFLDGVDFELSGGITFGMSTTDFESKSFASQFTSENAITGGTEYSHFEASNRIYLTFKDGKLVSANFSKHTLNK